MTRLFVDTNIILDWLLDRAPYADAAAKLFTLAEEEKVVLTTSALSVVNVAYFLRKATSERRSRTIIGELRKRCHITPTDARQIDAAVQSKAPDFEDAYQHACAVADGADLIITRDKKGFKNSSLPLLTAAEYIASYLL